MRQPTELSPPVNDHGTMRLLWLVVILVFLSGCAVSPKQSLGGWLRSEPRTIAVAVREGESPLRFFEHESRALQGAGEGAGKGAFGAVAVGSIGGGYGIVLGVLLMPVTALGGAIYGAATTEPILHQKELSDVEGATALFRAAEGMQNVARQLQEKLIVLGRSETRHELRVATEKNGNSLPLDASTPPIPDWADATLELVAIHYGLLGKSPNDPEFSFYVRIEASITKKEPEYPRFIELDDLKFVTTKRPIAEWAADDARLLKAEIGQATNLIAKRVIERLASLEKDE